MEQKIKRIHDYICQRVTYRNDNTLWVHSAASLFLDADPAFVCEGYAKSMKIFCYYMGINCACVSGTARGTSSGTPGAHMWNYVQMDDGNWYLVDATWDDVGTPPSSRYLLVGRATKGQYITIGEERVAVSYTHLDVYKRQLPVWTDHMVFDIHPEHPPFLLRIQHQPGVWN